MNFDGFKGSSILSADFPLSTLARVACHSPLQSGQPWLRIARAQGSVTTWSSQQDKWLQLKNHQQWALLVLLLVSSVLKQ